MPIFAKLFGWLVGNFYALTLKMFGAKWAVRLTAITTLAGLYVGCAITFSIMIIPWLNAFLSTQFGLLIGLLFPPIAGSVVASLGTFWTCILAKRYSAKLIKMTIT